MKYNVLLICFDQFVSRRSKANERLFFFFWSLKVKLLSVNVSSAKGGVREWDNTQEEGKLPERKEGIGNEEKDDWGMDWGIFF